MAVRAADALTFVNEAIATLSTKGWSIDPVSAEEADIVSIRSTIASDLKRANLGLDSPIIAQVIDRIEQVVVALYAARNALEETKP